MQEISYTKTVSLKKSTIDRVQKSGYMLSSICRIILKDVTKKDFDKFRKVEYSKTAVVLTDRLIKKINKNRPFNLSKMLDYYIVDMVKRLEGIEKKGGEKCN